MRGNRIRGLNDLLLIANEGKNQNFPWVCLQALPTEVVAPMTPPHRPCSGPAPEAGECGGDHKLAHTQGCLTTYAGVCCPLPRSRSVETWLWPSAGRGSSQRSSVCRPSLPSTAWNGSRWGPHPEERSWPGGQAVAAPGMVLASPSPEPPGLKPTGQPGAAVSCDNLTEKREEEGPARTSHPTPGDGAGGGAVSFQGTQEPFLAVWVS